MEWSYRAASLCRGRRVDGSLDGDAGAWPIALQGGRSLGIGVALLAALVATALFAGPAWRGAGVGVAQRHASPQTQAQVSAAYEKLPLSFEANRGQTDPRVKFLSRGAGYTLFLTPREAVLSLRQPVTRPQRARGGFEAHARLRERRADIHMRLAGARSDPRIVGGEQAAGRTNYLIGDDARGWHTGVASYARATYRDVYRGVDLVYHGTQGRLEYDFRVAPGADPRRIAIDFSGTRRISLDSRGDLVLNTRAGVVRQHKPVVYQRIDGERRSVRGRFVVRGHRAGFRIARYDHSRPLVIDPVLAYSTYLGGAASERGSAIAVDGSGNAYIGGFTNSADFPISDAALQPTRTGDPADIFDQDAFVIKLSPAGKLVYSTFLGGEFALDEINGIAVDSSGRAYVAGDTQSFSFPTTAGALQPTAPAGGGSAFVSVLNAGGSGLVYSTYLGGPDGGEIPGGIAVDTAGRAYVTGVTSSSSFPIKAGPGSAAPLQPALNGFGDAFVTSLDPDATGADSLVYSTYLGGSDFEFGHAVAVDQSGDAYVTGDTSSLNFPTRNPLPGQEVAGGSTDAFVAKLDPAGSRLAYSTYLGGASNDVAAAIALDGSGRAHVAGSTSSTDFPTLNAFQPQLGSPDQSDAFVTELSPSGSVLEYSSYLGGIGADQGFGIAVDSSGGAYVVGAAAGLSTASGTFPVVDPLANSAAQDDAFVARVAPGGGGLSFSSLLGGGGGSDIQGDTAYAVAVDGAGDAIVTGETDSTDFPTRRALQPQPASGGIGDRRDAFVAKIAVGDPAAPLVTGLGRRSGPSGTSLTIRGHGFSGTTEVRFGALAAERFTVDSDTQVTAIAPEQGDGPEAVTVTTAAGSSPANPVADFTYARGVWDPTGSLNTARAGGIATRLSDGRVLVVGGCCDAAFRPLARAELYDPADGRWHLAGSLSTRRSGFTATLLPSGMVLVAGGSDAGFNSLASAELFDPATRRWTPTRSMAQGRGRHTATLLPNGKVLVAGGCCDAATFGGPLASAEIYDPATETWSPARPLHDARSHHTATLLLGGKVLVAGGCCDPDNSALITAELYDPAGDSWTTAGSLVTGRSEHTATRLNDGRVLLAGGVSRFLSSLASAEVYNPVAGSFTGVGAMTRPRSDAAAALLSDGSVLVTGGFEGNDVERNTAELFDPDSARWGSAGVMTRYRGGFGDPLLFAVPLTDGRVLVGGGNGSDRSTELYDQAKTAGPATITDPGPPAPAEQGVPPAPEPPAGGADVTAPVVSGFRLSPNPFAVARRRTPLVASAAAVRHRRGTAFRYRLSEAASARVEIGRVRAGRRRSGRCVASTRALRRAKRCVRVVAQGVLTRRSKSGANRVVFSGRIGARALRPGRYRARLTAADAAKNRSAPKTITFTIVRR